MNSFWKYISLLGIKDKNLKFNTKGNILANQINFILLSLMFFALILLKIESSISNEPMEYGSLRVLLIAIFSFFGLFLSSLGFHHLSKSILAIVPSFLFLILPSFIGFIEAESFVYYPYVAITASILPPILFSITKEKIYLIITYLYSLLVVIFSDILLFIFVEDQFEIVPIIKEFYVYYKAVQIIIYLFTLSSINYLKRINLKFEKELKLKNLELIKTGGLVENQKNELQEQNAILEEQKEELLTMNEELQTYQEELNYKNDEISKALEERIKIQTQLVQNEKMASLGILTAGIAHEINNPINFIYAGIQSLEENYKYLADYQIKYNKLILGCLSPEINTQIVGLRKNDFIDDIELMLPQLIENIKTGVHRTEEIVKGLRNFSRLDETEYSKVNIHEGIESTLLLLRNKFKDSVEIIRKYDKNIDEINCYPGQLNQVFLNILKNALDSLEEKKEKNGTIKIIITSALIEDLKDYGLVGSYLKISIMDNGKGMNKEVKNKIFIPFFTTKNVGEGTGLGLSISHGIIEKHKGKLFVNSEEGKGSEFIIFIPANL